MTDLKDIINHWPSQKNGVYKMKSSPARDHVYFNDGFKCSSISITTNSNELNGNSNRSSTQGSNEFILTENGEKIIPHIQHLKSCKEWLKYRLHRTCTRKNFKKRLPIFNWLPQYCSDDLLGDLVAGITVGLTVIPQALAYSGIAGLPAAYGLYSSFLGCFIYIILGSCKDVPVGPSAILALLTFQVCKGSWQKTVLLSFLSGIVELSMGIFGLGFLIDFVSGPVSSGFTSAVSLIIVASQLKDIFGIKAKGTTFIEIMQHVFENISDIRFTDTLLGVSCISILLALRYLSSWRVGPKDINLHKKHHKITNKIIWLIATARNAILVICCGILGYLVHKDHEESPFKVIGHVPAGLPNVQLPPFSLNANETTSGEAESFLELVKSMGSGLIVIPLITLLETISICKAFANGKAIDGSQELIALGVGNIANAFVQGFPISGALSRGAVNNASGVRTPLSNICSGGLVVLALLYFTPYFYFIPKATLAAIIISAVIFMVEVRVVKPMWRVKKSDLIPGCSTFFACLVFPLEIGILVGVALNVAFILYHAARPKITMETLTSPAGKEYLMITPDRCLIFPSVDYVRNLVTKHSIRQNIPVVIDASHIYGADFTAATVIESLLKDFANRHQIIFFYNLKPSICALFEALSPNEFVVYYDEDHLDDLLSERLNQQKHTNLSA